MILAQSLPSIGSRPVSIEVVDAPAASVQVGMTTHVSVQLIKENGAHASGFGVVFKLGAGTIGSVSILGDDGASSGGRYDVTGAHASGAVSTAVILIDSRGAVYTDASVPDAGPG